MLAEKNITIPPFRPYFLFPIMSNEDCIDNPIVVSGVGDAIRPVVVELGKIDVLISLAQNLQAELTEVSRLGGITGKVGGGCLRGLVAPGRHLTAHLQLAKRHGIVKMAEAARPLGIEDALCPGRCPCLCGQLATELGEEPQILQVGTFDDEQSLRKVTGGYYRTTQTPKPSEDAKITQFMLENSNVNSIVEMTNMIQVHRAYESSNKLGTTDHDLQRRMIERLPVVRA